MFSLVRVWNKFGTNVVQFGNCAYWFGFSSGKCSNIKNKFIVTLKLLRKGDLKL